MKLLVPYETQHMLSTGQMNQAKTRKDTNHQNKSELRAPDHDGSAPWKHLSSHAEKHPDYDRMESENQKAPKKEPLGSNPFYYNGEMRTRVVTQRLACLATAVPSHRSRVQRDVEAGEFRRMKRTMD